MVDLETLGTTENCVFFSCGACYFDPWTGEIGEKYSQNIDMKSQLNFGRVISPDTVKWWMDQSDDARRAIQKPGIQFDDFLVEFANFVKKDSIVWGNGSCFDISILNNAYGEFTPWKFWNVRDVRTIVDVASHLVSRDDVVRKGTHHNALDDAIYQAEYVSKMWQALKKK